MKKKINNFLEKYNYEISGIICIFLFPILWIRYFFYILFKWIKKILKKGE